MSRAVWKASVLNHFDNTVNNFLSKNQIPGASLAITRNGKLVFAQGYGKVNTNLDASPSHLWRIASISKPITGVAIMKLVQEGTIQLSDKVFGPNSILGNDYNNGVYSARERAITVQQLLEHTAGGTTWNNDPNDGSSDPMFLDNGLSHKQLIDFIIGARDPSHWPGTIYSYSNFGYCILGRIIEKVTAYTAYQYYVKSQILNPAKAYQMYIAGNTYAEKKSLETRYYSNSGNNPYGMNVRRMDSHGGWITRPVDLLRFMVHYDGFTTVPDKLSPSYINTMVTPSVLNPSKAKGWSVNTANNWWHGGSLPGTMTILVRTQSGFTWSFMCNRRGSGNIDQLMWQIVNGVTTWPNASHDFF